MRLAYEILCKVRFAHVLLICLYSLLAFIVFHRILSESVYIERVHLIKQ